MELYSRKDVDKKALKGARIAVLGYGSQGRAQPGYRDGSRIAGQRKGGRKTGPLSLCSASYQDIR